MSPKSSLKPVSEVQAANPRMGLASIARTKRQTPDRIMLIGVEGVGKSTFAANALRPIFISSEDGLSEIEAEAFPEPETFADVLSAVDSLRGEHPYQTLVFDTLDWIEALVWQQLKDRDGVERIEDVGGGYGKGYTAAVEEFRLLISRIEQMVSVHPMEVIFLAHASISNFANPTGPDYARYEAKMNKKAAALFKEWCKSVLFATFEDHVADAKSGTLIKGITAGNKKAKGVGGEDRIIRTTRSAAWDAKNRFALPSTLPLSYEAYSDARNSGLKSGVYEACLELIQTLNLEPTHAARGYVQLNKDNPTELVKALARLQKLATETVAQ